MRISSVLLPFRSFSSVLRQSSLLPGPTSVYYNYCLFYGHVLIGKDFDTLSLLEDDLSTWLYMDGIHTHQWFAKTEAKYPRANRHIVSYRLTKLGRKPSKTG